MKSNLRVLMVTPSFHPIIGGTETAVQSFAVMLREAGIQADVMTYNMARKWKPAWRFREEHAKGFATYRIPALDWFPITHSDRWTFRVNLIPGRFTHLFREYDLIHFHDDSDLALPLFSYHVRKPKILHLHSFLPSYYKGNFLSRAILKTVVNNYVALSNFAKQNLRNLGIHEDRIKIVPNPVDTTRFHPRGEKTPDLVLFVGRLDIIKGPHVLLESLRHIERSLHLVIAGPFSWDQKYNNLIKQMIEKENQRGTHKISYIGEQTPDALLGWYQKASIFICPSLFETFGIANLEAMSCCTPTVATRTGAIPEIVQDGKNGILVEAGHPIELARAMQRLLEDEKLRQHFGEEGRRFVIENFSFPAVSRKLLRVYDQILQKC